MYFEAIMRSTLPCVGYGQLATRNIREEQMSESTTIHSRSTESTGLTAPMMYSCIFIISSFFVVECHAMHTPTTVYFGELMFNPSLPTLPPPLPSDERVLSSLFKYVDPMGTKSVDHKVI